MAEGASGPESGTTPEVSGQQRLNGVIDEIASRMSPEGQDLDSLPENKRDDLRDIAAQNIAQFVELCLGADSTYEKVGLMTVSYTDGTYSPWKIISGLTDPVRGPEQSPVTAFKRRF